MKENNYWLLNR